METAPKRVRLDDRVPIESSALVDMEQTKSYFPSHPAAQMMFPLHSPRSVWIQESLITTSEQQEHRMETEDGSGDYANSDMNIDCLRQNLLSIKRRMGDVLATTSSRDNDVFQEVRRACDPYAALSEKHHTGGLNRYFMNRSAMKLANMDYVMNFAISDAAARGGTFVDLAGAPGGFGEYLMWRNDQQSIGYGMSLIGSNDQGHGLKWRVKREMQSYQVCNGRDGTGDVCNWENIEFLSETIQADADPDVPFEGVELVVADGGTDAQRDSEYQEEISLKLFVCQVAAGLHLLKPDGLLLVKAFGFATETSRAVLYDLACFFEHIELVKPITSRPASAERYIIACGFRGRSNDWDGVRWTSRMLLGRSILPLDGAIVSQQVLCRQIRTFESEMLCLNNDACESILRELEDVNAGGEEEEEERVHLFSYRRAWELA